MQNFLYVNHARDLVFREIVYVSRVRTEHFDWATANIRQLDLCGFSLPAHPKCLSRTANLKHFKSKLNGYNHKYLNKHSKTSFEKPVFLLVRVRWIWVWSKKVDMVCLSPVEYQGIWRYERSSRLIRNLSNCEREAWKKIRASAGFEPVTSAIPVQCSTNWAMKP